ncbi:testis-specific gene 10 protein isoform X1 [Arapaima gigas]
MQEAISPEPFSLNQITPCYPLHVSTDQPGPPTYSHESSCQEEPRTIRQTTSVVSCESQVEALKTKTLCRMQRTRRSLSPTRARSTGRSPARAPPVKGGSYDSELMRVLRERDEMQAMLDRYERHLSEIQANIKVLSAERDKTNMQYQQAQEEIAQLRREMMKTKFPRSPKSSITVQTILKHVEAERDNAEADLRRMTTERDSLREQLKISQETAISNRAHLEQRVEDLQTTILMLEQERGEQKSRQALMKEAMTRLEEEVHRLSCKMAANEEELSKSKAECSMLRQDDNIFTFCASRLSNSQMEGALSESQRKLTFRIAELQKAQEKHKQLDEKNDSLKQTLAGLREEVSTLQVTLSELDHHRHTLQEQQEVKNTLLTTANEQLENKEKTLRSLKVSVEELEKSVRSVQETLSEREQELEATQTRLREACKELKAAVKAKEAALQENSQLQAALEKARLESQVATQTGDLKHEADDATLEVVELKQKIQDYVADISRMEALLGSKQRECRELQESRRRVSIQAESWENQARQAEGVASELRLELLTSETERQKLNDKVEGLEASLQEAFLAERNANSQLSQLNHSLLKAEEELRQAQSEHAAVQGELEKTRQLCVKLDSSKELVLQELDSTRSEVELLRKQLATERSSLRDLEAMLMSMSEKEHQQLLNSQERQAELQLLRDKLSKAENAVSSQSREVLQLRKRSAQLEADLEMTKRHLSTERLERERAVQELRRQDLSSALLPSAPLAHHSHNPLTSWSPERSLERSVMLREPYD